PLYGALLLFFVHCTTSAFALHRGPLQKRVVERPGLRGTARPRRGLGERGRVIERRRRRAGVHHSSHPGIQPSSLAIVPCKLAQAAPRPYGERAPPASPPRPAPPRVIPPVSPLVGERGRTILTSSRRDCYRRDDLCAYLDDSGDLLSARPRLL